MPCVYHTDHLSSYIKLKRPQGKGEGQLYKGALKYNVKNVAKLLTTQNPQQPQTGLLCHKQKHGDSF